MTEPHTPPPDEQPAHLPTAPADARPRPNAWLQLLRVPNLLTVPGDPLAGMVLAWGAAGDAAPPATTATTMVLAPTVAVLLYAMGLVQNDWFDRTEDARERPDRPIPSGRVPAGAALAAWLGLGILALGLAAMAEPAVLAIAVAIAAVVTSYNGWAKHHAWLGPANMGLCRGLSILLGAAVFGLPAMAELPVLPAAAGMAIYILAVTRIAAGETRTQRLGGLTRTAPALAVLGILAVLAAWRFADGIGVPDVGLAALPLPLAVATQAKKRLAGQASPATIQKTVGLLIRNLVPLQAGLCMVAGNIAGVSIALVLLVFAWPAATLLGRWFYAS